MRHHDPRLRRMRRMEALRPLDPDQLHRFVQKLLGLRVPRRPLIDGNSAPFDYLVHAFFEDAPGAGGANGPRDCVVWANRGGGKTYLAAVATLLDLIFKSGVQVRMLGGSLEQSSKMHRYLRQLVESPVMRGLLASEPTQRRVELINGSAAESLAQSQRSVRGTRVHKLRCDEVEEFEPDIWRAAQLVTRSGLCGPPDRRVEVRGALEALSTMHRPFGLMSRLIAGSAAPGALPDAASPGAPGGPRLFRWCALDVIERCPPERDCGACPLWDDCRGRAKEAEGFLPVDDLVQQRELCSGEAWASEMMCRRPRRSASVYTHFDPAVHVIAGHAGAGGAGDELVVAGVDFGMRSPMAWLWARVMEEDGRSVVEVFDEHVESELVFERHLERIESRGHPRPAWLGVDPAGHQRNDQTGVSNIDLLRRRGYRVRAARAGLSDGVELVRRRLDRRTLRIHPRCAKLVEAMTLYHFDPQRPESDRPVKDGPDHVCDALRYLLVNLDGGPGKTQTRTY